MEEFAIRNEVLLRYMGRGGMAEVPYGVKVIGPRAFADCADVTGVIIPWSVHTVAPDAFDNCGAHIYCPSPAVMNSSELKERALAGFLQQYYHGADIGEDIKKSYSDYIRINGRYIYGWALKNIQLLQYMTENRIIPDSVTDALLKKASGNPEAVTMLLGYQNTFMTPQERRRRKEEEEEALLSGVLTEEQGRKYWVYKRFRNGGAALFRYMGRDESVIIPSSIGGEDVKEIADNVWTQGSVYQHDGRQRVKSVCVPDTVIKIAAQAFAYCVALESVVLPEGIGRIGGRTFMRCDSLREISIPANVKEIGEEAFLWCGHLKKAMLHEGLMRIRKRAFAECIRLEEIRLPDTLTEIGEEAFAFCYKLKNIYSKGHIRKIGDRAFKGCRSLESFDIEGTADIIGAQAFAYCENMKKAVIGEGTALIEKKAFYGCGSLSEVFIPKSVMCICGDAFGLCPHVTLRVFKGSEGEKYAIDNQMACEIIGDGDDENI